MEYEVECDSVHPLDAKHPIDSSSLSHKTNKTNGLSNSRLIPFSVIFINILLLQMITCKPLGNGWLSSSSTLTSDEFMFAMEFLTKFGYLPKSHINSINLRSEAQLKAAISSMQAFANMEPTGLLNNQTLKLMKGRRCGVPDIIASKTRFKRYLIQGSKWKRTNLTWSVKDWTVGIDSNNVIKQFKKAFKIWSDVSKLTFTETRRPDADIVISFLRGNHGDEYPFDGPGGILGHAFFPGEGIGGDAHFDADEQWDQRKDNSIDDQNQWEGVSLFSVAAHEFGHSLGLSHSSVADSLMFPYYQTIDDDFKLPYDDSVGIQQLYGSQTPNKWAPIPFPAYPVTTRPKLGSPTKPMRPSIPKVSSEYPNPCNISIDAIASIRRNIFIFKTKYFWWIKEDKIPMRAQPLEVYNYWTQLPKNIVQIDAVYERPSDKRIAFFIAKQIWIFNNLNKLEHGYPQPLTSIGLPPSVERVDAVMVWGHNAKTYIFVGSQYWRFEENDNRVELDYPRDISVWKGIPSPMDAAFQWFIDSQTYFFKDQQFWKFDDRKMKVSEEYPQRIPQFWFPSLCKDRDVEKTVDSGINSGINLRAFHTIKVQLYLLFINILLFYNFYIF